MENKSSLKIADPEIEAMIAAETHRQRSGLELIASENFVSAAVLEAVGSTLTNKYAEGLPGKRYYGGCEEVDKVEALAISRVCNLFGAQAANVQAHSGSQANMAAYMALLKPGDTLLALDLNSGGHLTHGATFNFSGRLYNAVHYGLRREDERIDMDQLASLAKLHRPKVIVAGASAYSRAIDFAKFREVADSIGAFLMVDMAHIAGLIAGGVHGSPIPFADIVTSTAHKTLRGPRSGFVLMKQEHAKVVNSQVFPGIQGGPLMHVIAGKAVAFREALQPGFKIYARQIVSNAKALCEGLAQEGFRLVSGGTDNHLILVDLRPKNITGKAAEATLGAAAITVNKNQIPFDPEKPTVSSGIRVGTAALTTRGMREPEMKRVAAYIGRAIAAASDDVALRKLRSEVEEMAMSFPLFAAEP